MEAVTENLTKEENLQIVTAVETDDRATLYALLEKHGINCYLLRTWDSEDQFESTFFECGGNVLNLAVHFNNEALALELLSRGADVRETYDSAESSLGWSEGTTSLLESAVQRRMAKLVRMLMLHPGGADWGAENRYDCDAWCAGRWTKSLFTKVLNNPDHLRFIAEVGLFAGSLQGQQVKVSSEGAQFRIQIGEQDHGMRATMTEALGLVRKILTPAHSDSAGTTPESGATHSSTMLDEAPF